MPNIYKNPVIFADFSDPDAIRVGDTYYMVSSSFNFVPGIPLLKSRNLVEWEIVNYILKKLPFERFDGKVRPGDGVWAPSLREHDGKFYCSIPFPDDGIYVCESKTDDIEGEWTWPRPLICGKGLIDPCPVWADGKCYMAVAFAKSRAGFNSKIGVFEVSPDLTECISPAYKTVYDGSANNPVIEGPKFYRRNGYFYILAPAGSVKSGWQTALRSRSVYGPYESKIVLMQGDSLINGPHQGALVDSPDGRDWFMHFQDRRAYGRIVHLQPVEWQNDWPICGKTKYDALAGTPVCEGEFPTDVVTGAKLQTEDFFNGKALSGMWQFPANPPEDCYEAGENGLKLFALPSAERTEMLPQAITAMIVGEEFCAEADITLCPSEDGDEAAFGITGRKSAIVSAIYCGGKYSCRLTFSGEDGEKIMCETPLTDGHMHVKISAKNADIYRIFCSAEVNGKPLSPRFEATAGVWVGARLIAFARNKLAYLKECGAEQSTAGYALIKHVKR